MQYTTNESLSELAFQALFPCKNCLLDEIKVVKMENKPLKISVKMAAIMGVFLPLAETVRRSNQLFDLTRFLNWFDDYILGSVLLIAVYLVKKKIDNSISFLIAAWGFVSGALFLSFLGHFQYHPIKTGDLGIFPTSFVAIAKGLILLYMLIGLYLGIKSNLYQYNNNVFPKRDKSY